MSPRPRTAFRAKAFGLVWVRGRTPVIGAALHARDGVFSGGAVGADRISTGLGARDRHLRSSHYLRYMADLSQPCPTPALRPGEPDPRAAAAAEIARLTGAAVQGWPPSPAEA
jgi:hypothetical protein